MNGLQSIIQLGTERALNTLPEGLLIAALTWLLLRLFGRQNSRTRFTVWFAALLAVVAFPFISNLNKSAAAPAVRPEVTLPGFWATVIFAVWGLLALLAVTRAAFGVGRLRSLRQGTEIPTSELPDGVRAAIASAQAGRQVELRLSSAVRVPTVVGFFRPVILLPDWALKDLSEDELRVILLHELAHLQRWDDWTNLAQKIIRAIFFFHPAVWWIERRLSLEREMACDDLVLAYTADPRGYAECLVSLAEKSLVRRSLAMAQTIIGHARETSRRLAHILDINRPAARFGIKPLLGIATALGALGLVVLPHTPALVAFQNSSPTAAVSAPDLGTEIAAATVVPAAVKLDPLPADRKARPNSAKPAARRALELAQLASAKALAEEKTPTPRAVLARASAQQTAQPQRVRFVMQTTTQYDEYGNPVWSVSVWRAIFVVQDQSASVAAPHSL